MDYIVTALVDKSGGTVGTNHQFPICTSKKSFRKNFCRNGDPLPNGDLGGITRGLEVVEDLQPFNRQPHAMRDPLAAINRFSNADKHRVITEYLPLLGECNAYLIESGEVVDKEWLSEMGEREANGEFLMGRLRFAPPYPSKPQVEAHFTVTVYFNTPAVGKNMIGQAISFDDLQTLIEVVVEATERFKIL